MTFLAPVSKVTEGRANNILSYEVNSTLLHEIIHGTSDITVRLPSFKKGDLFSLEIRTRENEIDRNEVFTSYERDNPINGRSAILWSFGILICISIFRLVPWDRKLANS